MAAHEPMLPPQKRLCAVQMAIMSGSRFKVTIRRAHRATAREIDLSVERKGVSLRIRALCHGG